MCCNHDRRRPRERRARFRGGFSFIELMIVIVIIGLLTGAVTVSTRHYMDKAKQTRARSDIVTYKSAIESFYAENGRYPTNEEGLNILVPKLIDRTRTDPWSHAYQYNAPGRASAYEIISFGADGRDGGDGANRDITSDDPDTAPANAGAAGKAG